MENHNEGIIMASLFHVKEKYSINTCIALVERYHALLYKIIYHPHEQKWGGGRFDNNDCQMCI